MGEALARLAADGHPAAGVEAALMVETGSYKMYDALVVVSARPDVQIARVCARDGVTEEAARKVLQAQLPLADKVAVADIVVHNNDDLTALEGAVEVAWEQLRGMFTPPAEDQ